MKHLRGVDNVRQHCVRTAGPLVWVSIISWQTFCSVSVGGIFYWWIFSHTLSFQYSCLSENGEYGYWVEEAVKSFLWARLSLRWEYGEYAVCPSLISPSCVLSHIRKLGLVMFLWEIHYIPLLVLGILILVLVTGPEGGLDLTCWESKSIQSWLF